MHASFRFLLAGCVVCSAFATTSQANDLEKILRILAGAKKQSQPRDQRWQQQRNQRYNQYGTNPAWPPLQPQPQPGWGPLVQKPTQIVIPGAKPGVYQVPNGIGTANFQVISPTRTGTTLDYSTGVALANTSAQLMAHLSAELKAMRLKRASSRADDASEELQDVAKDLARRRLSDARGEFTKFKRDWGRFAAELRGVVRLPADTQARLTKAASTVGELEQWLAAPVAKPQFDRLRVAALAQGLANASASLYASVTRFADSRRDAVLLRYARRTRDFASDLYGDCIVGRSYETIVREYEFFDKVWHHLKDDLLANSRFRTLLRGDLRKLSLIDRAMHQELHVEPPAAGPRASTLGLARQAARVAHDLEFELRVEEDRHRDKTLIAAGHQMSWATEQLAEVLRLSAPNDVSTQRAAATAAGIWQSLQLQLRRRGMHQLGPAKELASLMPVLMKTFRTSSLPSPLAP